MEIVQRCPANELIRATVGGEPLDAERTYALATNGFVVGSDVWPSLGREHVAEKFGPQYEAVVEYAREVGVAPELDGRLRTVAETVESDAE
jgi:hypothetical protein